MRSALVNSFSIWCIQNNPNNLVLPGDPGVVDADAVADVDASELGKEEK